MSMLGAVQMFRWVGSCNTKYKTCKRIKSFQLHCIIQCKIIIVKDTDQENSTSQTPLT